MLILGIGLIILQGTVLQPLTESAFAFRAALFPLAIVSFIAAYGLLKGLRWAWTATLVLSIISIVWYVISIAITPGDGGRIIGIFISAVIIYYLYRPHVKGYFGKEVR